MKKGEKNNLQLRCLKLALATIAFLVTVLILVDVLANEITHEAQKKQRIALTFDDGPKPEVLNKLLPFLQQYKIPATFFVMGWKAKENSAFLSQKTQLGHGVENHTYGHENLKELFQAKGEKKVVRTILRAEEVIYKITGQKPHYLRPPLWQINDQVEQIIVGLRYKVMKQNAPDINTLDYKYLSEPQGEILLIKRVKQVVYESQLKGKFEHVLVFHETEFSINALEKLIPYFLERRFQFVRLDNIY